HQHDAEHEAPIADTVRDESFLGCGRGFVFVDVISNQQVRAETDTFPADEHQKEIISEHQRQHREHEQIQISEEAVIAAVTAHVAGRKDVNQQAYKGDEERVDTTEPV